MNTSVTKIITVLIYMNESWDEPAGRLRLLRSSSNLNDIIVEVPPIAGTLLAFKRSNNSWDGHEPFVFERRVHPIQLAYAARQSPDRHASASHFRLAQAFAADGDAEPAQATPSKPMALRRLGVAI